MYWLFSYSMFWYCSLLFPFSSQTFSTPSPSSSSSFSLSKKQKQIKTNRQLPNPPKIPKPKWTHTHTQWNSFSVGHLLLGRGCASRCGWYTPVPPLETRFFTESFSARVGLVSTSPFPCCGVNLSRSWVCCHRPVSSCECEPCCDNTLWLCNSVFIGWCHRKAFELIKSLW